MRVIILLALSFIVLPLSAQLPNGFVRELIATDLNPTSLAQSKDGRIFIVEKHGVIRVIRDNQVLNEPFLTIEVDDGNEKGLGHMVLHPDFDINGYVYIYFSVPDNRFNRVSRWTANGDKVIPGSEKVILDMDEIGADIHNGGAMVFGHDGYLYISSGDGSQSWVGEDLASTNAKILRITDEGEPVPDNPFFNLNLGRAKLVYATGLRNPFTMTINPVNGKIYANDVGQAKWEEINRIEKGSFYGWPRIEGKKNGEDLPSEYLDPVYQYHHSNKYCAVVGSTFYLPEVQQFPQEYRGRYFYSDYCTGHIRMLNAETGEDLGIFMTDGDRVVDLLVNNEGSLYYLERRGLGDASHEDNGSTTNGNLWKISYTGAGTPFISVQPKSVLVVDGEDATFNVSATGAFPLTYRWFVDDLEMVTENVPSFTLTNVSTALDSSVIRVDISNDFGLISSETAILRVTSNNRPIPNILLPIEGDTYVAGSTLHFSGEGSDEEDGLLNSDAFEWKIDFHHGTHSHPSMPWTASFQSGQWIIPSIGETASNVFYRIYLRMTDSYGLVKTVHRDIFPQLGSLEVRTSPPGLIMHIDGAPMETPHVVEGVRGVSRYISPPYTQIKGDSIYFFDKWQDGSKVRIRDVKTSDQNQEFVCRFEGFRRGYGVGLTASYYDNIEFMGPPLVNGVDSTIDHQWYLQAPLPNLSKDYFSIKWKGYIQAYKSALYKFIAFVDDGAHLEIDGEKVLHDWGSGLNYVTGYKYLEASRLYTIELRMYDLEWTSQIKFRWSSDDFVEEIVPSSQLYPSDYYSSNLSSTILSVSAVTDNELQIFSKGLKDVRMNFTINSVNGFASSYNDYFVPVGESVIALNIGHLIPGAYFMTGIDPITNEKAVVKFVKVK